MASPFQSVKKWKSDAFLNFRRQDFAGSFVADLYKHLEDIRIKSERGAPISAEISDAILESRISITDLYYRLEDIGIKHNIKSERGETEPLSKEILQAIAESRVAFTDLDKLLEDIRNNAFKHDFELERGEGAPFSTELLDDIEESRVAITDLCKSLLFKHGIKYERGEREPVSEEILEAIEELSIAITDLCKSLEDIEIDLFTHGIKYERGASISTEISDAIEESKIAITIFSRDYASSTRCLDELTKIMECVDNKGLVFVSVFYHTNVSEVSRIIDQVLAKHEAYDLKDSDLEMVQRWKDALSKAFNIAGLEKDYYPPELFQWQDEECIEYIVDKTSQGMNIAKYPVGIRSRVEEVKSLLKVESGGVRFIGVWGMAGVGKTTVARTLFNEISCQFEGSYFLANVRRVLEKHGPGGLPHLQHKLLSQILKKHSVSFANLARGSELIGKMLRFKKVLIVLDDMDNSLQLEYLDGKHDWFGDGSRVITTTRNFDLLSKHDLLYRVPELTNHEALELFSWHAFQQGAPVKDFEELSCCVVDYAKGLPLALQVLGSFLYKQSTKEHISALYRLQDFRDGKIDKNNRRN